MLASLQNPRGTLRRSASGRLSDLLATLQQPVEADPFQTAGYRASVGALTDALRTSSEENAGRLGGLGLSTGMALAAQAGNNSRALATGVRQAASASEAQIGQRRTQNMSALLQALGLKASLDSQDRDRDERKRAAFLSMLGTLGGSAAGFLIGGPPGAAVGAGLGRSVVNGQR